MIAESMSTDTVFFKGTHGIKEITAQKQPIQHNATLGEISLVKFS